MKKSYITKAHRILEILSWILIAVSFGIAIYGMNVLPSEIATHFNARGVADNYGSPAALLILPIVIAVCLGFMSLIAHFVDPSVGLNMPFVIREENKGNVYRCMMTILFLLELEIGVYTVILEIQSFGQQGKSMGVFLVVFLAVVAVTVIEGCVKAWKYNKE